LKPGASSGLYITAHLEESEYNEGFYSQLSGMYVFITQQGVEINTQIPYIVAVSGQETQVNIRKQAYRRERDAPWTRCHSTAPEYTQETCRANCIYAQMRSECGCRQMGDLLTDTDSSLLPFCLNEDYENCVFHINQTAVLTSCDCSLPPCIEDLYPHTAQGINFSPFLLEELANIIGAEVEYVNNNIVVLKINYEAIRYSK